MIQKNTSFQQASMDTSPELTDPALPFLFDKQLEGLKSVTHSILAADENFTLPDIFNETDGDKQTQTSGLPHTHTNHPSMIFLQGPSGMGKTTLLSHFLGALDAITVSLTCHEAWTDPLCLLKELVASLEAKDKYFTQLFNRYDWGLRCLRSPQEAESGTTASFDSNTTFMALSSALSEAATEKPLVMVFDDIEYSDPVVLACLHFLGRAVAQPVRMPHVEPKGTRDFFEPEMATTPRLLMVATCQSDIPDNYPTRQAIHELQNAPFSLTCTLPQLNRKKLQQGLGAAADRKFSPATFKTILDTSQKNTLLASLLLHMLSRHQPCPEDGELSAEAEAIAQKGVLTHFLSQLPEPERKFLSLLAIFRRPIPQAMLDKLSALNLASPKDVLSSPIMNCLIKCNDNGYYLAHTQVRKAARHNLAPSIQKHWHDTLAATLMQGTETAAFSTEAEKDFAVTQHAIRGSRPDQALAMGLNAAVFLRDNAAHQKSLVLLYNLLGILKPNKENGSQRLDILQKIIDIELLIKRPDAAKQNLKRLLSDNDHLPINDATRARIHLKLAKIYQAANRHGKALRTLGKAFSKKLDDTTLARLLCLIGSLRLNKGDVKKALNYSLRGLAHAHKDKDPVIRSRLLSQLAQIYKVRNDYALAVDSLLKALDTSNGSGAPQATLPLLDQLGQLYLEQGNYFRAARYLYRALEAYRNIHDLPGLAASYTALGEVYARSGNYVKAIEHQQKASEIRERLGDWPGLTRNLIDLGTTYPRLGKITPSITSLKRAIAIAEKSGHTQDIVSAFMSLAETYFFIGNLKEVESLIKQVNILSQEYGLPQFQARAAQLEGKLLGLRRQWDKASKKLKKARDGYTDLGEQVSAIETRLDLANLAYQRELYADAYKLVAKTQINAEEVRNAFLQAKALLIKGNTCRFLKHGASGKWQAALDKALEVARSVADLNLHFEILYSLGKAHHYEQSFAEAEDWYRKAEDILERIASNLSEDEASKFWSDKRRQIFREDYLRFKRESGERGAGLPTRGATGQSTAPVPHVNPTVLEDLLAKISRLNNSFTHEHFFRQVLGLIMDLVKADRGFLVETTQTNWQYMAFRGLKPETLAGRMNYAETLVSEAYRKRKFFVTSDREEEEKYGSRFNLSSFKDRVAMLVPIIRDKEILGVIYMDKTLKGDNGFLPTGQEILAQFTPHIAVAWQNRKTFLSATTWAQTPFLVEPYFNQVISNLMEQEKRGGKPFALLGIRLPYALNEIDENGAKNVQYILGREQPIGVLGESLLVTLLTYETTPKDLDKAAQNLILRLKKVLPIKKFMLLQPERSGVNPADLLKRMKELLHPSEDILREIQSLAGCDLGLKDAKQLLEKHLIMKALRRASGNITRAADTLNIHRPQLSQLLKKHELRRETFAETPTNPV